jgi:hypothetical protein
MKWVTKRPINLKSFEASRALFKKGGDILVTENCLGLTHA